MSHPIRLIFLPSEAAGDAKVIDEALVSRLFPLAFCCSKTRPRLLLCIYLQARLQQGGVSAPSAAGADSILLLLTQGLLSHPQTLQEIHSAIEQNCRLVAAPLAGRGYEASEAPAMLSAMQHDPSIVAALQAAEHVDPPSAAQSRSEPLSGRAGGEGQGSG